MVTLHIKAFIITRYECLYASLKEGRITACKISHDITASFISWLSSKRWPHKNLFKYKRRRKSVWWSTRRKTNQFIVHHTWMPAFRFIVYVLSAWIEQPSLISNHSIAHKSIAVHITDGIYVHFLVAYSLHPKGELQNEFYNHWGLLSS